MATRILNMEGSHEQMSIMRKCVIKKINQGENMYNKKESQKLEGAYILSWHDGEDHFVIPRKTCENRDRDPFVTHSGEIIGGEFIYDYREVEEFIKMHLGSVNVEIYVSKIVDSVKVNIVSQT